MKYGIQWIIQKLQPLLINLNWIWSQYLGKRLERLSHDLILHLAEWHQINFFARQYTNVVTQRFLEVEVINVYIFCSKNNAEICNFNCYHINSYFMIYIWPLLILFFDAQNNFLCILFWHRHRHNPDQTTLYESAHRFSFYIKCIYMIASDD